MFIFRFGKSHEESFSSDKATLKGALSDFYDYMEDIHNYLKCGGLFGDYDFYVDDGVSYLGYGNILHHDFISFNSSYIEKMEVDFYEG